MVLRLLIIDPDRKLRGQLRVMLASEYPEMSLEEYDTLSKAMLKEDFPWHVYQFVLLAKRALGKHAAKLIRAIHNNDNPPEVILLTSRNVDQLSKQDSTRVMSMVRHDAESIKYALADLMASPGATSEPEPMEPEPTHAEPEETALVTQDTLWPNIPGYPVLEKIGEGGMSRVYLARSEAHDDLAAVKVLDISKVHDPTLLERFILEHKLLRSINHPRVVAIYAHKLTDTQAYIVTEYFPGGDLEKKMKAGLMPNEAIHYLRQIGEALEVVHAAGIIHRDLKPANLMLRSNDDLVLVDFGVAKERDTDSELTRIGQVFGTPAYISPERAMGAPFDERSDIYSAGAIFYEMLVGDKLYSGRNPRDIFYQHIRADIPRLPDRFAIYQPLLDMLLAKRPKERCQTASELIYILDENWPGI